MRNKYFMAEEKGENLNITIYGDITSWEWLESDVSSYTLSKLIQNSGAKTITVSINSYGGEVSEGLAIYNALRSHPAHVVTVCDGFACSAASVVFMAGDERIMNEASLLMIHNAWTYASGSAEELRKQADDLDVISQTAAKTYLTHINISEEELQTMLTEEAWITPEDAIAKGFATAVREENVSARQQYSAKRKIIRQLVEGKSVEGGEGQPAAAGGTDIPEEPESGFRKLFDKFHAE
ncbi:MAG: Clp protease ClpP [Roseburia sp.]|nr:Clp protease ClpP [Roseburia sp.]MCM1097795.1 Clp protease ClpP [Ruminococcus flavefaciens]